MKTWENRAIALLEKSLYPLPAELNELDWKSALSNKSERLVQHISAFSNLSNGGFMVYGIDDNGKSKPMPKTDMDNAIGKLGNIARNNLEPPVTLDHSIADYKGSPILIIHIEESGFKPTHLRGQSIYDSYKRSAGQTVKMSSGEVRAVIAVNDNISFEEQLAGNDYEKDQVLKLLDFDSYFRLAQKPLPENKNAIFDTLQAEELIKVQHSNWSITNLGAILFSQTFINLKV